MAGTLLVAGRASANTSKVPSVHGGFMFSLREYVLCSISQWFMINGVEIHKTFLACGCSRMECLREGSGIRPAHLATPSCAGAGQLAISLILSFLNYKLRIIIRIPGFEC